MKEKEIEELCEKLGVRYRSAPGTGEVRLSCPFAEWTHDRGQDRNPSMSIAVEGGGPSPFICHGCGIKGTTLDLVDKLEEFSGKTKQEIGDWVEDKEIRDVMDFEFDRSKTEEKWEEIDDDDEEDELSDKPVRSENELKVFKGSIPRYLINRGISSETARKLELGYDKEDNRVVFPVRRRPDDGLVGLIGRSIDGSRPKYLNYWNFNKSAYLYGEHLVDMEKPIYVVEGPMDAAKWIEYGIDNTVAVMGALLSVEQVSKLKDIGHKSKVVLAFDGDGSGRLARENAIEDLQGRVDLRFVQIDDGRDPDELSESEAKSLVENPRHWIESRMA